MRAVRHIAAMRAILLGMVLALTGCQSKPVEQMSYSEIKALAASLEKQCNAQGYARGHPEFKACVRQEFDREYSTRQEAAARRRAVASSVYCQQFGASVVCF